MNGFSIETEHLIMRVLNETYAELVLDYYNRNINYINPWEPARPEGFYTVEYHREILRDEWKRIVEGNFIKLWIFKKSDPTKVIGAIALNNIVRGCFLSCHLGYKLDEQEAGNGYMTEAARMMIHYAFKVLKLHRIEANIMPANIASMRVVEKLGFYYEGLAKKYLRINGKWEDHVHMVLLNEALE